MNSKISQETYQEILSHDYKKSTFLLNNFYISNKKGEASFSKNHENFNKRFSFSWCPAKQSYYTEKCKSQSSTFHMHDFHFSNFEELTEKLEIQYFCSYHAYCSDRCPIGRITSPEDICAICLKNLQMHVFEETECEHRFCLSCLDRYVKSRILPEGELKENCIPCPVCKRDLKYCDDCENPNYDCICT
jgi:hypothetical protein